MIYFDRLNNEFPNSSVIIPYAKVWKRINDIFKSMYM